MSSKLFFRLLFDPIADDSISFPVVESLLDSGAKYLNTDRRLPSPLQLAARIGSVAVCQKLITRYPQTEHLNWADNRGWSALIEAAANGRLDVVKLLLDKGANLMATDENRRNILHVAALRGHIDVVRFLLNEKKDMIDTVDAFGATPLLVALDQGRVDVAGLLIIKGADLKKHDREGFTPAHVATLAGTVELLKVLGKSDKAVLEAVDFRGRTPLLLAAGQGNVECVKFLINEGVNIKSADRLGRNALMLAAAGGHTQIVKYLLDKQPGLINLTDENCNPAIDLTAAEPVRAILSATPFTVDQYVNERLDKINARTRELAQVREGFANSDADFAIVRDTLRKDRPEKVLQFVTRVLASAVTRPLCDFETADPPAKKIEALAARIASVSEGASIEEQVDAVRHRGRMLIMMHERCRRRQDIAGELSQRIENDTRKPVLASIADLEGQISSWELEKKTLAEEREAYEAGLQNLIGLIAPLKNRFKFPVENTPELLSLVQFENQVIYNADQFHADFADYTTRLSEDVRMLNVILQVVETQSAQINAKFEQELAANVQDFNSARQAYDEAWGMIKARVQSSYETVSTQFANTTAQFELINAQNPMGEIRKSYLTVLNRLENEKAFHERLLERLSQIQEDVGALSDPAVPSPIEAVVEVEQQVAVVEQAQVEAQVQPEEQAQEESAEQADEVADVSGPAAGQQQQRRRQRTASGAQSEDRGNKYKSRFFFEQDALRAAEGEDSQGSASSLIAAVLRASSVTDMVVPPELLVEVTETEEQAEAPKIATITPFSRGNSLQEITGVPAAEPSPADSEASDVTVNSSGAPPVPGRPDNLSGKGPEGIPSIIPARLMQQLAMAEPGSSASIRAVRETHSVAKMLKQFEAQAQITEEPVVSPRSRSTSRSN